MSEQPVSGGVQQLEVSAQRQGQRLDNFLIAVLGDIPRSVIYRIIRTGQVRVDGKRAKPFTKLEAGQRIRVPPLRLDPKPTVWVPPDQVRAIEEAVVCEEADFLVVDKPAGIAVHGGSGVAWGLIDALRQVRPDLELDLAHRLDRDTSGLLLVGKNPDASRQFQAQFRGRDVSKAYLALLDGRLPEDQMRVDQPLLKIEQGGERSMCVDPAGKPAVTEFRRLHDYRHGSYVEANPITGRTHQIRAHAQYLGSPCAGDPRYSSAASQARWRERGLMRLFLHSHRLEFTDPRGQQRDFSSLLPPGLRSVLDRP